MGRGRAKAKQTKVARELKYRSIQTDFSSLERELRGDVVDEVYEDDDTSETEDPDPYAELAAEYEAYTDDEDYDGLDERRSS
ncbi:DUF3073 domain-containing protein [Tessaracoccus sp. MC1756]|uniref:DUF3073 domain-containing protein n=1 Tax=Tessaracoccus sp. MC1756 TaxID=2760311 RepID=UPI001600496B|nr:DUF3073 domain-containing protein [Tessaracoccus sp. MC1756]MBB1508628.1 DUF3073 domain-containing protein [Tessaracoccus sp. MC1756]